MIPKIRALSIAGPFGWAIASGKKSIELRSWFSAYNGIVLLHASSGVGYEHSFSAFGISREDCPKFSFVGAAKLKTCVQYNSEKLWDSHLDRHLWQGDESYQEVLAQYGKFPFGHVMVDPILFRRPIENVKGAFSYWLPKTDDQKAGFESAIALLRKSGYLG